ncbi:mitochondrial import protein Pam17 [Catenaria anguillulae PL171]|uniref:Presequence translocated-associated motor subunit PAM17 n=1 Tax=Catenaria anguillulae PL171 TaxID=765915 RepID=A0A1Y2HJH7_9FUNG|nr:mitochondrial import protein Pam17 [Catenaria anguillulae PL171]
MHRHQSTLASPSSPKPTPASSSAARATPTPSQPAQPAVTWTEYLSLRKDMRLRNQIFSFVMSPMAFVGATFYVAATYQFDPTETIMGIESPWIVGIGAMTVGAIAATMTPVSLEALWRVVNPTKVKKLDALDREFYRRIQKHRAHASLAGPQLHLFDYYGATVVSRETYRKWLRKQRKTKQKAEFLVQSSKIKSA